ncbi:hypothetical protein [Clostridium perfringens]|uniref:hypothetical protein n=1 Tax=Clostridium perfringens TaxID=1502 RepID=UPI00016667B6|nr:hypothetical protein [Clostridium perfringens]EDS79593.1 hypothetical protein CPC_A0368 [Clostridium perfringens C str. JGS1495]MBI6030239.1 hypothetical protein [Clostridium perfringens]MBI6033494.1 hypothetical protein [Clostridium perfringens]MBI6068048.1 hypothetical protein [Clostridium perfringens]MBI6096806.1 hypothetical protein [Clostridium perfringens]
MSIDYGTAKEKNLIVNEGAVYIGSNFQDIKSTKEFVQGLSDKLLGYFEDKLTVSTKPKIEQIKNAAGKVKGFERVVGFDSKITGSLLDFNKKLLETSLFKEVEEGHYKAHMGLIDVAQYKDALVVGENEQGEPIIILIKDVLNREGLNFDMKGKDNSSFKISIENSSDDGRECPVEIFANFTQLAKH